MKIALIGYSGGGKSTMAAWLSDLYQIPVLYLDQLHWLPGWVEQTAAIEQAQLSSFLEEHTDWIIDGNYFSLEFASRMAQADQILFFDFSRFLCLKRCLNRYHQYRGRTRASITQGCEEKIDGEFLRWILWDGRKQRCRKHYEEVLRCYGDKVIHLRNQKELEAYKKRELQVQRKLNII